MGDRSSETSRCRDSRELARLVEWVEGEAWAEMQLAVTPDFRERLGIEVRRRGGVALLARRSEMAALNRVVGLGFDEPLTPERLDALVTEYREAGVPKVVVQWSPEASPDDALAWFKRRGGCEVSRMAKVCRPAAPDVRWATDLSVVEIDARLTESFGAVVSHGYGQPELAPGMCSTVGLPRWRHYFVYDGDRPVAGAAMYARDEIAWCGLGATLAPARGRGAQSALLARRVRDAAALGCRWVAAETMEETERWPNPSYRNMRRLGFDTVYLRPNYVFETGCGSD